MDVVHVDAVRHKLEAEPAHLLQQVRIALGEPRRHGNGGFEPACFERTEDAPAFLAWQPQGGLA